MKAVNSAGPYARAASGYWENGWTPIPLPVRKKYPPARGWTGATKTNSGGLAPAEQISEWMAAEGDGNICLRMPKNVIGIDVDMYGEKVGRETLRLAEEAWGALPKTWSTTSRSDGSGIRLFRVPEGLAWPGKLPQGGGIELVRWDHRYAIVAPSLHPDGGAEYHWVSPDGDNTTEADGWEFPAIEELPYLPETWVEGLTGGKPWVPRDEAEMDSVEVTAWLTERGDRAMCETMERTLQKHLQSLRKAGPDGGAHDAARDGVWAIIGDSGAGHNGVKKALSRMQAAFKEAVKGRRTARETTKEWRSFIEGGVRKVAAEGDPETEDICEFAQTQHAARTSNRTTGSSEFDYTRDDSGNALRFVRRYRDNVRYVDGLGGWHVWSRNRWVLDTDGEILRMAMATVAAIEEEVKFIEEVKEQNKLRSFIRASSNEGKLNSMVSLSRSLRGMTVPEHRFNANDRLLVVDNGTIELGQDAVRFRASRQEDYNTSTTPVPYAAGAESPDWNKFLERFQPDLEVRDWLQKLAGYSLLGANPKRFMVICFGPTSTGKTTFAKAVGAALGEYAASTSMSVFRDNQDEKPRADLVRILSKRLVYAEEASASWHLHPDQIKRLTGGSPISARRPYAKEYIEAVPAFTPWMLTNHAPTIEGADTALWRRLLVVPFDVTIPQSEEDPEFEERLLTADGLSAVMAWMVEGWRMYVADPDSLWVIPAGALKATAEFRAEVSDLARFLDEVCEAGEPDEYQIQPGKLYQAYTMWCEDNGVKDRDRISNTKLGRELNGLGHAKRSVRIDGKTTWVRVGLRLKGGWVKALGA